jgi:hypothetical protein
VARPCVRYSGRLLLRQRGIAIVILDAVEAAELSKAVVAWTGFGTAAWPIRDDAAFAGVFSASDTARLAPIVKVLEASFYQSKAAVTAVLWSCISFAARSRDVVVNSINTRSAGKMHFFLNKSGPSCLRRSRPSVAHPGAARNERSAWRPTDRAQMKRNDCLCW